MVRPVVKWAAQVPVAGEIPFYLGRACAEAVSGRMGAVHLTIPVDVFRGWSDAPARAPVPMKQPPAAPPSESVERALALLREAERPVVIAGSGVWWARAEAELAEFIEKTSLPVYTIAFARGLISDNHPLCMGSADPALNKAVHRAFQEADVLLVLGKRIDYRLALGGPRLFPAAAKFIQVDIHPQELGMNRALDVGICADVKATLSAFLGALGKETWPPRAWLERLRCLRSEWEASLAATAGDRSSPPHPAAVYSEVKGLLPAGALYSWDGADFGHWGRAILSALVPGGWIRLGPLGTIGAGLPNAIALQLANPGKRVVLFTGDGSLGFYLAELDTLVRHELPVVVIVGNDAGWGLERELQKELNPGEPVVACELRDTRYDIIMQGFGGGGETVEALEQLGPAVARALGAGKPYLLNVRIRGVRSPFTEWQIGGKKRR